MNQINGGIVYVPTKLFRNYYEIYSREIDKQNVLERYDKRYDNPPNEFILGIWKDKEWGYISNICDDEISAILFRMFFTNNADPYLLKSFIEDQHVLYNELTYYSRIVYSSDIYLQPNPQIGGGVYQLLLSLTKSPYHIWNWRQVLGKSLDTAPYKGSVTIEDTYDKHSWEGKFAAILMFHGYKELDSSWIKQEVPSKKIRFPHVVN